MTCKYTYIYLYNNDNHATWFDTYILNGQINWFNLTWFSLNIITYHIKYLYKYITIKGKDECNESRGRSTYMGEEDTVAG